MSIRGKALLVIERVDSQWIPFDVQAHIQTCTGGGECRIDCAQENFSCCESDSLALPGAAHKMQVGDRIWVAVTFRMDYHQSYEGEWDVTLDYSKERVLKRRRINKRGKK